MHIFCPCLLIKCWLSEHLNESVFKPQVDVTLAVAKAFVSQARRNFHKPVRRRIPPLHSQTLYPCLGFIT